MKALMSWERVKLRQAKDVDVLDLVIQRALSVNAIAQDLAISFSFSTPIFKTHLPTIL